MQNLKMFTFEIVVNANTQYSLVAPSIFSILILRSRFLVCQSKLQ